MRTKKGLMGHSTLFVKPAMNEVYFYGYGNRGDRDRNL